MEPMKPETDEKLIQLGQSLFKPEFFESLKLLNQLETLRNAEGCSHEQVTAFEDGFSKVDLQTQDLLTHLFLKDRNFFDRKGFSKEVKLAKSGIASIGNLSISRGEWMLFILLDEAVSENPNTHIDETISDARTSSGVYSSLEVLRMFIERVKTHPALLDPSGAVRINLLPIFIMTSPKNHSIINEFLISNAFFGYQNISLFDQDQLFAFDTNGKFALKAPLTLVRKNIGPGTVFSRMNEYGWLEQL